MQQNSDPSVQASFDFKVCFSLVVHQKYCSDAS